MKVLFFSLPMLLSGCFYSLAGIDMSVKGRRRMWVQDMQQTVGKSMFTCSGGGPCFQYRGRGSLYQGEKTLDNGNTEAAYVWWHTQPKCRYFFEYQQKTGLIVGFRFEESEPYACRISGA